MKKAAAASILCAVMLLTFAVIAEAQQPKKVPRIGYLSAASASSQVANLEAFRKGLRELGYAEGKNFVIDERYAEEKLDRLNELGAELIRLNVDVIVTGGPVATRAAKGATSAIPIVMGYDSDPVGNGFVSSLAHPGGNITGLSSLAPEISGKQLELLKEIVPKLSRVAVLGNSTHPGDTQAFREMEQAATAFSLHLQFFDVRLAKDMETSFRGAGKAHTGGIAVLASPLAISQRAKIAELAVKNRIPAIYPWPEFVQDGGLMSYGVSFTDMFRRAATYVDKMLKGTKPADIPVEQPKKFEFIINLKAAKQIGLTIPPNVLARADRVIK
jgi:ABC-type uncharacterized transport system substrate-binding protein